MEKMKFAEWLETTHGITWEEWDENYSGQAMEEIEAEYDEYFRHGLSSREIRAILGVSRAEFSRRYGIPVRTLEEWDAGRHEAPEWVMRLLERVVREDAKGQQ